MADGERTLRVGLLGAGDVADLHAAAVRRSPDAVLHALWNRTAARGRDRARELGCAFVDSAEALVADPELDCVFVLTNLETHRRYAELAMRHGKHVLVEKPAAATVADIQAMQACALEHGVQCVPVHNYVYDPGLQRARALLEQGRLGRLVSVHVLYNIHHPEAVAARYPGVIRQIMTHHAYVLRYLAGPFAAVQAMRATINDGSVPQENLAMATVALQSGALAHLQASFAADDHAADPWTFLVKVIGTEGATRYSYRDWVENRPGAVHSHTFSAYPEAMAATVRHFLDQCVRRGRPPLSDLDDAVACQRLIEACEQAIAERRTIPLEPS